MGRAGPLRRVDKELRDPAEVRALLERALVLRLAMADGEEPYLVPLLFAAEFPPAGGRLYLHCAREGRKLEILARNPRVCFEVEEGVELRPGERPCDWSLRYRSVIGRGRVVPVDDPAERRHALDLLARRCGADESRGYGEAALKATVVLRVEIEELTGKVSGA